MKRKNDNKKSIFKYQGSECPVCIEEMSIESRSVTSPCMHEFCLECIGKWLTESSSTLCPLCKQSVKNIIYNIRTHNKYSKINFPKGFNNAWLLRNKIKNILDNFENIIFKIWSTVETFLTNKKNDFDLKILDYLTYFGNIAYRPKSSSTNKYLPVPKIPEDEECWHLVEHLMHRLSFMFSKEFIIEIFKDVNGNSITYRKLLEILKHYLDQVRYDCLKLEIETFQMRRDPSVYLEYYVPGDHEHIIYKKHILIDKSTTAAIITRIITSINIENLDFTIAGYQISNIDHIFCILEYFCSFEKLISHLSFSAYYILLSTEFYSSHDLKKSDISLTSITMPTCHLIKHCFQKEELEHITQTLSKFEKRLIYFEPLLVDDSIDSEISQDEFFSYQPSQIIIELSDSDDDALEIISVNHPVYDLTESVSDDDVILEEIPNKKQKISFSSDEEVDEKIDFQKILGFCQSSILEPTTSVNAEMLESVTQSLETNDLSESSLIQKIENLSDDDQIDNNDVDNKDVDFIYQPRSVNDFYDYLMSQNLPGR